MVDDKIDTTTIKLFEFSGNVEDYKKWSLHRETETFRSMWIMKPNASSCGRGIKIIGSKQVVPKK